MTNDQNIQPKGLDGLRPLQEGEKSQMGDFVKLRGPSLRGNLGDVIPCDESDCGEIYDNDVGFYFRPTLSDDASEHMDRLRLMASGDPKWDLSENDRAAILYALSRIEVAA